MELKTLDDLVVERIAAKRAEDAAIEARRAIDAAIAAALRDPAKTEGSVSRKTDVAKVTVTYGITRKADTAQLQAAWAGLSSGAQAAFKWGADVSVSALKALTPADALVAAKFITAKPSTPSVSVEIL